MINQSSNNAPENELTNRIKSIERQLIASKSSQPILADSLRVDCLPSVTGSLTWGPTTIAAGRFTNFYADIDSTGGVGNTYPPTLYDVVFTPIVDTLDAAHGWPFGGGLTSGQFNLSLGGPWFDLQNSSRTQSKRRIVVQIKNNDTASHVYYLQMIVFSPHPTTDLTNGS